MRLFVVVNKAQIYPVNTRCGTHHTSTHITQSIKLGHHRYNPNANCRYHQGKGHTTDRCYNLRHAIQDLIDQQVITLPSSASNPDLFEFYFINYFLDLLFGFIVYIGFAF